MSETVGRAASTSGGAGRAPVRRGFDVYTPAARLASKRAAEASATAGAIPGNGYNTSGRGHDLWEDTSEDPNSKIPKGDSDWKRDRWNEEEMFQASRRGAVRRGAQGADSRSPPPATVPRGRGAKAGTAGTLGTGATTTGRVGGGGGSNHGGAEPVAVDVEVPSGEQFEDISRKVEEEVVAKLARAQVMGMMFKAHREQEMGERRGGTSGGARGGGASAGASTGAGVGTINPRRRRADRAEVLGVDRGENERGRSARAGAGDTMPPRQVSRPVGKAAVGTVVDESAPPTQPPTPLHGQQPSGVRQPPQISSARAGANAESAFDINDHRHQQLQHQRPGQGDMASDVSKLSGAVVGAVAGAGAPGQASHTSGFLRVPREELATGAAHPGSAVAFENLGADPEVMSLGEAYSVVGKLERYHKALIEEMRKDSGTSINGAGSKPGLFENGSAASPGAVLSGRVARVRGALSRTLESLIRRDAILSLRKRLPNRLWMLHYREMELIQQRLRAISNGAGGESGAGGAGIALRQKALRTRLFELIEEAEGDLSELVNAMEGQILAAEEARASVAAGATKGETRDGEHDDAIDGAEAGSDVQGASDEEEEEEEEEDDDDDASEESLGRRQALHTFLANLGDLARYRSLHGDHGVGVGGSSSSSEGHGGTGSSSTSGNSANALTGWARSEAFYRMALRVDPNSGKVWNQIAVSFSCRGDNLEAFYAYLRAVCAATPFNGCRENLLVLHEKCKARLSTLREATALDALGMEEHQARFRLYLLGACGTCLSRVDLSTFDGYLALAERHMVSCIQLYLMKSMPSGGGIESEAEDGAKGLEGTLARAILLCVCTASASFEGWQARGMEGGSWTQDAATSRAVRLCMSLASALAGLHRRTSKRGWERLTAAGVGVFLDWLVCRPQFGEGARGTGLDDFQHVMACVVEFANGVVRAAAVESANRAAGGNAFSSSRARAAAAAKAKAMAEVDVDPDGPLWEDEECRGLPALEMVAERRARKARRRRRALAQQERKSTSSGTTTALSASSKRGAFSSTPRGSGRGGIRGGKRGGGARSMVWPRSGKLRSSGGDEATEEPAGSSSLAIVDAWMVRVARIRQQVEFCVERGWIARGGRPGTYTLPKPPSRSSPPRTPRLGGKDGYEDYDEADAELSASVAGLSDEGRDARRSSALMDGAVAGAGAGVEADSALNRTLDPEKDLEGFDLDDDDIPGGEGFTGGETAKPKARGRGVVDGAEGSNGVLRQDGLGEAPLLPPPGLMPDESVQANAYASLSQRSPRGDDPMQGTVDKSLMQAGGSIGQAGDQPAAGAAGAVTTATGGGISRLRHPRVPVIPPGQHQGVVRSSEVGTGIGVQQPLPPTSTPTPVSMQERAMHQATLGVNPVVDTTVLSMQNVGLVGKETSLFVTSPVAEVPLVVHQQGVVAPGKSAIGPAASTHQAGVYQDAEAAAVAQALSSLHLQMEARENQHGLARGEEIVAGNPESVAAVGAGETNVGQFGVSRGQQEYQHVQSQAEESLQEQQPYLATGKGEWNSAGNVPQVPIGGLGGVGDGVVGGFEVDRQFPGLLALSDLTLATGVNTMVAASGTAAGASTTNAAATVVSRTSNVIPASSNGEVAGGRHCELPESLLGIVLAGLGPADEHLCTFCCATLTPGLEVCPLCGIPVTRVVPPAGVRPGGGGDDEKSPGGVVAPVGGEVEVSASGTAAERTQDLSVVVGATAAQGKVMRGAASLPAGVLAVNNIAEVMASSHRPKQSAQAVAPGGPKAATRARGRDSHNPTVIARAGMGDGGVSSGARGGGAGGNRGKTFGWPRGAPTPSALPLVVIDVPNVAMRHGLKKKFSCKGVQMAIEFFRTAGHRVVGFLPDYYLDEKATSGLERAQKLGVAEVKASRLADDVPLLKSLLDDGLLVATPPQDYDDSYCIKYAMARDGYVVTNDLYRDHVKGIDGRKKAEAARRWIKMHSISYTFVGDEFFPNPDFSFHDNQGGGAA